MPNHEELMEQLCKILLSRGSTGFSMLAQVGEAGVAVLSFTINPLPDRVAEGMIPLLKGMKAN